MKLFLQAFTLTALAALLQGCMTSSNSFSDASTKARPEGQFTPTAAGLTTGSTTTAPKVGSKLDKIFAQAGTSPEAGQDYRIGVLDVLDIGVLGAADLNKSVQVGSSGTISLPLLREVPALGRTPGELEKDISARLAKTYMQNPQVTVAIKEYNSQRITVDGAVQKPGIFPKQGDVSLLQAVAQAQGLTNYADPTGVLVFRTVNHQRTAARFDIRQVRNGKQPDPMLLAGDIVMVDESSTKTTLRDITMAMPLTGLFAAVPLL
ncbi:polysaccharide biosynthesis/export family protein [Aestuariivirga litoralis]|uniref:polysaccharide biosynthesis/export family protein n=1 Tax=Aestuariivirga litoralis TaxID=2650924 RepID=UPI0018C5D2FD|nr:polysaccharide biosynthesis/export family protein [Aestuariivirga litoralis]MBG1232686.1 polysaccharide export protein [Aestuariivirga litoralis]